MMPANARLEMKKKNKVNVVNSPNACAYFFCFELYCKIKEKSPATSIIYRDE